MSELIRIIYISKATFDVANPSNIINAQVQQILEKSRLNNSKNNLNGILYFGDGFFFQCLEGPKKSVENLYDKLKVDPRHKDLKIVSYERINSINYSNWKMKYAHIEKEMQKLMIVFGFNHFDPYLFDEHMIDKVLKLLEVSQNIEILADTSENTHAEVKN